MRIFKSKPFARFARKARLTDAALIVAIDTAELGLIDADWGGGVIKQRVPRPGGGKSGGFRTIVLFRLKSRAFFVHGFAKSDQDNISADELAAFKMLAEQMLSFDEIELAASLDAGVLLEVIDDEKAIP